MKPWALLQVVFALSLATVVEGYPNHLPEPDLAFDFDSQTSTLTPGVINGVPATAELIGSIDFVPGVVGNAIEIDGDEYINLGDQSAHCFSNPALCEDGLTLAFWIQFNDLATPGADKFGFVYTSDGFHSRGITIQTFRAPSGYSALEALFADDDNEWVLSVNLGPFAEHVWYHFTYIYNIATGPAVYLNGTEIAHSVSSRATNADDHRLLYIGAIWYFLTNADIRPIIHMDRLRAWHGIMDPFEVFVDGRLSDHCDLDSECPDDEICYFYHCTDLKGLVCLLDSHCGSGKHCHDRTCIADGDHCHMDIHCRPTQHCHPPICYDNIHHCEGDSMCPDGMHCMNRICFNKGDPCDSDDDCPDDFHCKEPRCLSDHEYCKDDNDCGYGFHCHDSHCFNDTTHCHVDKHCGDNSHCLEPLCFKNSERCFTDIDCVYGYHCHETVCVLNRFHCEKEEHCESDEHCYKTVCLKDSLRCQHDKHCEVGQHCHNAVCYLNENHCHDHFVCGEGYHCHGGICYENSLHCHSNTDCGPGHHCHSEICYKNSIHCHHDGDCPSKHTCMKTQCIEILPKKEISEEVDMDLIIIVAPVTGVVIFISLITCIIVLCFSCHHHHEYPYPPPCPPPCPPPYPPQYPPQYPPACPPLRPPSYRSPYATTSRNRPPVRRALFNGCEFSRPPKGEPIYSMAPSSRYKIPF